MVQKEIFHGAATALITPFHGEEVDYERFGKLIDWQIESGIDALVIAGTTGEGSTLTDAEHRRVLEFAAARANRRVPMIAGTGSNDTAYAVDLTRYACTVGYDGILAVTPYYNKATQKGLIRSYQVLADASEKPLILYNVPSRTGVNIEPETYAELAEHPNIAGIKEANGNLSKIMDTFARVGGKLSIYSGNDDQILPLLAMGGSGVISVLSNLLPGETSRICKKWFSGEIEEARSLQTGYLPLIHALFCEVNPIPVKAAMAAMGFCENNLRLPLTPMEEVHEQKLLACMKAQGIL